MRHFTLLAAFAGGALLATPALADTVVLTAALTGAAEPDGGDAKASGSFRATIDTSSGDVCYMLSVADLTPVTAAHVHEGAAGATGAPVMTIEVTGADDEFCIAAQTDLLQAINTNPAGYYVNVHTKEFPAGAIRGQLTK